MEQSLGHFKSVRSHDRLLVFLLGCLFDLRLFLGKVDPCVMVLFQFLEEIIAGDHDLLSVERDTQWVRTQRDLLDLALVTANEALKDVAGEGHLRHQMELARVILGRDKDPLCVVPQVLQVLLSDEISQCLEVTAHGLERLLVSVLVRDESTSAYHDRR